MRGVGWSSTYQALAARSYSQPTPSFFQHPSSDLAFASLGSATFSHKGRRKSPRASSSPRPVSGLAIVEELTSIPAERDVGKTGGSGRANLSKDSATSAARPAISVPVRSASPRSTLPCGLGLHLVHRPAHRAVVAAGEPLDRTSPGKQATLAQDGSAVSSPPDHRRDRRSRRRSEDSIAYAGSAWIKGGQLFSELNEINGLAGICFHGCACTQSHLPPPGSPLRQAQGSPTSPQGGGKRRAGIAARSRRHRCARATKVYEGRSL